MAETVSRDTGLALALTKLLEDPETEVRENAAEAIGRIGDCDSKAPGVLKVVVVPKLMNLLRSSKEQVREVVTYAFSQLAEMSHLWEDYLEIMEPPLGRLIELLGDPEVKIRKYATVAVRGVIEWLEAEEHGLDAVHPAIPFLSDLLGDPSKNVREEAVQALRPLVNSEPEATKMAVGGVIELLRDSYDSTKDATRLFTCLTLREMAGKYPELLSPAIPYLQTLLQDCWNIVRCNAALTLVSVAEETSDVVKIAMTQLIQLLEDPKLSSYYADHIIRALGRVAKRWPGLIKSAVLLMKKLLEHPNEEIRGRASQAIKEVRRML